MKYLPKEKMLENLHNKALRAFKNIQNDNWKFVICFTNKKRSMTPLYEIYMICAKIVARTTVIIPDVQIARPAIAPCKSPSSIALDVPIA